MHLLKTITIISLTVFATLGTTSATEIPTSKEWNEFQAYVTDLSKQLNESKAVIKVLSKQIESMGNVVLNLEIGVLSKTLNDINIHLSENSERLNETNAVINNLKKELKETKGIAEKLKTELADTKEELLLKTSQDLAVTKDYFFNQLKDSKTDSDQELKIVNITINSLTKEMKGIYLNFENKSSALSSDLQVTADNFTQDLNALKTELTNITSDYTNELDTIKEYLINVESELKLKTEITSTTMIKFSELSTRLAAESKATCNASAKELQEKFKANKQELEEVKIKIGNLTTDLKARTSEIVDIGKIPASCSDLQEIGYKTNGLFSVMGNKSIETVYCNFQSKAKDIQKWIGSNDIKSMPTYFYVTRISPFSTTNTPIPFDLAKVNIGNAMELASGKFRAPRPGIYFFSFTGHAFFYQSVSELELAISLYLNGNRIGWAEVEEANTSDGQFSPLTLQSTIKLKAGDQIWLQIVSVSEGVVLFDRRNPYTHFTGWMLEEDIVASLSTNVSPSD
uniref:C1q domain-containing protein n=1 Tax=Daphnia galeata TaxID=27404 RepID=A0A8J2WLZ2_9CRUS|nr:unnamed protein product [Daphnia galeata]